MNALTIVFAAAFVVTLLLLIRSLFQQAGIQDAIKETSDEAHSQMKLWEEFGQHLDEGVALVNEQGDIEYVNAALAELAGWPNRSAFHQPLGTIIHLQDEEAKDIEIPKSESAVTFFCLSRTGSRTPVHVARRALHRPIGYTMIVLRDATAENAEKELRHRLVNLSSFELRAPVTAMKGYASMLLDGDAGEIPEEAKGYIKPILESTDSLLELITDMASVEELSTKRAQARRKVTDVAEYLAGVTPRLSEVVRKADRQLESQDAFVHSKFEIDPDQITRLLVMLTNTAARTASPKSAVVLSVAETERTIDIHLTNEGEPLPKQNQANVFDYVGGRGLDEGIGFYVAKQIIESHHAFVTVNTRAEGNVFIVSLPKIAPPIEQVTPIEQVGEAPSSSLADSDETASDAAGGGVPTDHEAPETPPPTVPETEQSPAVPASTDSEKGKSTPVDGVRPPPESETP